MPSLATTCSRESVSLCRECGHVAIRESMAPVKMLLASKKSQARSVPTTLQSTGDPRALICGLMPRRLELDCAASLCSCANASLGPPQNAIRVAMVIFSRCCFWLAWMLLVVGLRLDRTIAQEPANVVSAAEATSETAFDRESLEFFENKIRPLLVARCHRCHGPQKQEAGLRLDSRASILQGGDTGPAMAPHEPDQSLLIDAIRYGDTFQMPPKQQLPADEIALLEEWVRRGGPWPSD